jgi:hypothetical protein
MKKHDEERIASTLAKTLTMMCVRNSFLEDLHAGKVPATKAGDYSDVKVIDAEAHEISWTEISRLNDDEMKLLMKQIVDRIYTFFLHSEDDQFQERLKRWMGPASAWEKPEV